jgi:hypothetical protein
VTEAMNREDELYGSAASKRSCRDCRVRRRAPSTSSMDFGPTSMRSPAGAEPADDLTIVALRWRGPGAAV